MAIHLILLCWLVFRLWWVRISIFTPDCVHDLRIFVLVFIAIIDGGSSVFSYHICWRGLLLSHCRLIFWLAFFSRFILSGFWEEVFDSFCSVQFQLLLLLFLYILHQSLIDKVRKIFFRVDNDLFHLISAELLDIFLLSRLEVYPWLWFCIAVWWDMAYFVLQAFTRAQIMLMACQLLLGVRLQSESFLATSRRFLYFFRWVDEEICGSILAGWQIM